MASRQKANFLMAQENSRLNEESLSPAASTMAPARPHKRSLANPSPTPLNSGQHFMASIMAFESEENVVPESPPPKKKQKTSSESTSSDSGISCDYDDEVSDEDLAEFDEEIEQYLTSEVREVAPEDVAKDCAEDDFEQAGVFFDEQAYYEKKQEMQWEEQENEPTAERKAQEIHHKYFHNYF